MLKTKPVIRFSLAAMMLTITFVAIGLGVWRRFQEYKAFHRTLINQAEHIRPDPGPATFRNFLSGKVYRVDHLSFQAKHTFGDDEMATLLPLKRLHRLSLHSTGISDGVAETLTQFTKLRVLSVAGTEVGDTFVHQISELKQLEELYLSQTKITDEGMTSIAKLEDLRVLTLSETAVSNVGLRDVAKLTKLESLSLQLWKMPTHWLAELEPLTSLQSLKLSGLDEMGVQELAKIERLEKLQVLGSGYVGHLSTLGSFSPPGVFTLTVKEKLPSLGLVSAPKGYRKDEKTEAILQERRGRK